MVGTNGTIRLAFIWDKDFVSMWVRLPVLKSKRRD